MNPLHRPEKSFTVMLPFAIIRKRREILGGICIFMKLCWHRGKRSAHVTAFIMPGSCIITGALKKQAGYSRSFWIPGKAGKRTAWRPVGYFRGAEKPAAMWKGHFLHYCEDCGTVRPGQSFAANWAAGFSSERNIEMPFSGMRRLYTKSQIYKQAGLCRWMHMGTSLICK